MKATINGIVVEGTAKEIDEYQKIMDDMRREGTYIKPPLGKMPDWLRVELRKSDKGRDLLHQRMILGEGVI